MLFRAGDEDTICALSTPPGSGGVAIIRVSGANALAISRRLCAFLPAQPKSHQIYYGLLSSGVGVAIDEVLASYFQEGRSFTGEETVEINCHGGEVVSATILKELVGVGCRLAKRGEFTYRAFMNGRLDLVQAESVLSLIESQSKQSAKIALRQLQGHLSADLAEIEDGLVWVLAHLEASIDFSTEDIEVVKQDELISRIDSIRATVGKLVASYNQGRILKDGLEVALIGRPNVGKSSLLNALVGEERAIVTAHAGTTRDTIEGRVSIGGLPVTFIDTAGIRETDNEVEKIGIERSRSAMEKADFVFYIFDVTEGFDPELFSGLAGASAVRAHVVMNKTDLDTDGGLRSDLKKKVISQGVSPERIHEVSAKTGHGIESLRKVLASVTEGVDSEGSNIVTQARHLELLQTIGTCLASAEILIEKAESPEFIAFELQSAVRAIHELLGKEFNEQIIDRIFKEFCLGK